MNAMQHYEDQLRRKLDERVDLDVALEALRAAGASKVESIACVRSVCGCDLAEAKRLVHLSLAWDDVREMHDHLHDEVERAARDDA
jgi:ribosomal protein L7/L12